jgi:hypothetical protein
MQIVETVAVQAQSTIPEGECDAEVHEVLSDAVDGHA